MCDMVYRRVGSGEELVAALATPGAVILAGATDIIPRMRRGNLSPRVLVDISRLSDLRGITDHGDEIWIGPLVTHQELAESDLLRAEIPALAAAAATIGCPQTRNRGTLGGNLANASPAADTAPPLMVHAARVVLFSGIGSREVGLEEFFTGPGQTCLKPGEYIGRIKIPKQGGVWGSGFLKLGKRKGMAIAVASAAAFVRLDENGLIGDVRVALGSVAPTPTRGWSVERALVGKRLQEDVIASSAQKVVEDISPIDDIRGSVDYRRKTAVVLTRRALEGALAMARGGDHAQP